MRRRAGQRGRGGESGFGLVELLIGLGISGMLITVLGMTVIAVLQNTAWGRDQQSATHQLRGGLFWLNQDTQSAVASQSTITASTATLAWTDLSTGTTYDVQYQQAGSELHRTLTTNGGSPATRVVARNVPVGGFAVSQSGLAVSYTLGVTNGAAVQTRSETATMRPAAVVPTPFFTVTPAPTSTFTPTFTPAPGTTATPIPTNTPTPTLTNTPTPTLTNTPTPTLTSTPTPVPTSTPTPAATNTAVPTSTNTSTPTPTATNTAVPTSTNTPDPCPNSGYLSPSANAVDTGGDGNGFEVAPASAYADGGGNASNVKGNGDRHRYYNYGIMVPAGCSFAGIVVRQDYRLKNNGGTTTFAVALSWDGGTTWTAAKSDSSEPILETSVLLGGATDTWGHAFTSGQLGNANFRLRVTMTLGNGAQEVYLDWLAVRVYFQ